VRIALFSDTHGNIGDVRDALLNAGPFDLVVHLGDGLEDGIKASREEKVGFIGVRGNEDYRAYYPDHEILSAGFWKFLLLHGFQFEMNRYMSSKKKNGSLEEIAELAKERKTQGLFFGHDHEARLEIRNGVMLFNPGDMYIGSMEAPTFGVVDVADERVHAVLLEKRERGRWMPRSEGILKSI